MESLLKIVLLALLATILPRFAAAQNKPTECLVNDLNDTNRVEVQFLCDLWDEWTGVRETLNVLQQARRQQRQLCEEGRRNHAALWHQLENLNDPIVDPALAESPTIQSHNERIAKQRQNLLTDMAEAYNQMREEVLGLNPMEGLDPEALQARDSAYRHQIAMAADEVGIRVNLNPETRVWFGEPDVSDQSPNPGSVEIDYSHIEWPEAFAVCPQVDGVHTFTPEELAAR